MATREDFQKKSTVGLLEINKNQDDYPDKVIGWVEEELIKRGFAHHLNPKNKASKEKLPTDCLIEKNKKLLDKKVQSGESVDFCLVGVNDQVIIALDHRLLIIKHALSAGASFGARVTSFFYKDITAIEVNTGLTNGVIEVCTPSYQRINPKDYWSADKNRDPRKVSNCLPFVKSDFVNFQPYIKKLRSKIDDSKRLQMRMK